MTPPNEEELSVRILAGWKTCYWCERLHDPADLTEWQSSYKLNADCRFTCVTCHDWSVENCRDCKATYPNGM